MVDCKSAMNKCTEDEIQSTKRYRVALTIKEGDNTTKVTLFEECATIFVGCGPQKYLKSIDEGETNSIYYNRLSLQTGSNFYFMILTSQFNNTNGSANIAAHAIERIEPLLQHVKQMKIIHTPEQKSCGSKIGTKVKRKLAKKKKEDHTKENEDEDSPKQLKPTKRRRGSTKKKQDQGTIEVISDDDITLQELKEKKTISTCIKIKKEKS